MKKIKNVLNSKRMPERPVKQCAVVVFTNQTALPWLRLLSCGFRHCFVAVEADCGWIVFDPLSNVLKTNSLAAISSQELANWYRANGYRVMISYVRDPLMRPAPWALFTCVEAVKRLLGIHSRWVVTPWQLWKFLNNENNP